MRIIELTNTCACASEAKDASQSDYVFYTGGVAGISDTLVLENHSKSLKSRPDEIELERH
jgi:hypothetical protein